MTAVLQFKGFDPYKATPAQALEFMTDLFEQGLGYSAMNTVRSAFSQVLHSPTGVPFGELPTVKQVLKEVFQEKPTLPRYCHLGSCYITIVLKDLITS